MHALRFAAISALLAACSLARAPSVPAAARAPAEADPVLVAAPDQDAGLPTDPDGVVVVGHGSATWAGHTLVLEHAGRMNRLDALLDGLRARWGLADAGVDRERTDHPLRVIVQDDATMTMLLSVLQTAAFAGARPISVEARGFRGDLEMAVPRPPIATPRPAEPRTVLRLAIDDAIRGAALETTRPCAEGVALPTPDLLSLASSLRVACAKSAAPCLAGTSLWLKPTDAPPLLFAALAAAAPYLPARVPVHLRLGSSADKLPAPSCGGPLPGDGNGRLAAEVIQAIIRKSFSVQRKCYEDGLAKNPDLRGKITTRFVIGVDGRVTSAEARQGGAASGLVGHPPVDPRDVFPKSADAVVDCVVGAFRLLTFPPPEGGIVTVEYPIIFQPDDSDAPAKATPTKRPGDRR